MRFVGAAESPARPRKRYIFQSPSSEIGTVERIRQGPLWLRKVKRIKVSDKIMDQDQIDLCPWFDCFSSNKHILEQGWWWTELKTNQPKCDMAHARLPKASFHAGIDRGACLVAGTEGGCK